jgi:hypothetical protein
LATWTNKQWGAVIAALVVFSVALVGIGATALVVIFGIVGYFAGKFLDGELDLEDIRDRAQGRRRV